MEIVKVKTRKDRPEAGTIFIDGWFALKLTPLHGDEGDPHDPE